MNEQFWKLSQRELVIAVIGMAAGAALWAFFT